MAESEIQWTDFTANPWEGCMKVSPLCDHCYAEVGNKRFHQGKHWGPHGPRRDVKNWKENIRKAKAKAIATGVRQRVFIASIADIFEKPMPMESNGKLIENYTTQDRRNELWKIIEQTPECIFLLLTKRPQNIHKYIPDKWGMQCPENVWFGCSVGTQAEVDLHISHLLEAPGGDNKFLSCEPLLEQIDIWDYLRPIVCVHGDYCNGSASDCNLDPRSNHINWVIVGGESGHHARPIKPKWIDDIKFACEDAKVPFFFKQWGAWIPSMIIGDSTLFDNHQMVKNSQSHQATWLDGKIYQEIPKSML